MYASGVEYDSRTGVIVNDKLQTSNKNIYAVGDVCSMFKFTHVADFMARLAIRNALFFGRQSFSSLLIPWATYTDPEIAHVGKFAVTCRKMDACSCSHAILLASIRFALAVKCIFIYFL